MAKKVSMRFGSIGGKSTANYGSMAVPSGGGGGGSYTKIISASATASGLAPSSSPTVSTSLDVDNQALSFVFGIPKGDTGETGPQGPQGDDGVGVSGSTVQYARSSSQTTPPTSGWQDTVPETTQSEPYIWTKTVITYTNMATTTIYSVGGSGGGDMSAYMKTDGSNATSLVNFPYGFMVGSPEFNTGRNNTILMGGRGPVSGKGYRIASGTYPGVLYSPAFSVGTTRVYLYSMSSNDITTAFLDALEEAQTNGQIISLNFASLVSGNYVYTDYLATFDRSASNNTYLYFNLSEPIKIQTVNAGATSIYVGSKIARGSTIGIGFGVVTSAANYAEAHGHGTLANKDAEFVIGQFNDYAASSSVFETRDLLQVGNGTFDGRSNAFVVRADGTIGATNGLGIQLKSDNSKSIKFGIDSNGKYGYYKDGETTVTPFRNPTGTATVASVLSGGTFSNVDSDGLTGIIPVVNSEILTVKPPTITEDGTTTFTNITSNGTYYVIGRSEDSTYNKYVKQLGWSQDQLEFTVNVATSLQTKTQTVTPAANWSGSVTNNVTITPDSGYDGLSSVTINVPMLRDGTMFTTSTISTPGTVYNGDTATTNTQQLLRIAPSKNGMSYTNSYLYLGPSTYMGNATAADVASGKTFSSVNGILVTGAMVLGSVQPSNVLSGQTFSSTAGTNITGTMTDYTGSAQTKSAGTGVISSSTSGTAITNITKNGTYYVKPLSSTSAARGCYNSITATAASSSFTVNVSGGAGITYTEIWSNPNLLGSGGSIYTTTAFASQGITLSSEGIDNSDWFAILWQHHRQASITNYNYKSLVLYHGYDTAISATATTPSNCDIHCSPAYRTSSAQYVRRLWRASTTTMRFTSAASVGSTETNTSLIVPLKIYKVTGLAGMLPSYSPSYYGTAT